MKLRPVKKFVVFSVVLALVIFAAKSNVSAQPASEGIASGGFYSTTDKSMPNAINPSVVTKSAFQSGWNYKNCDYVNLSSSSNSFTVTIHNTDTSFFTYTTTYATGNTYQQMMMRACRSTGASYGVYITNATTGAWNAMVGY